MEEKNKEISEQFDIVWLLKYLFAKRAFVLKTVGVCTLLCVIVCLCKPNVYTATASLIPVGSNSGVDLGGLNSLASLAGVNMGKSKSGVDIVTPDLYPKVAQSTPFLREIADVKVPWTKPDTVMSFYEHACWDSVPSVGECIKKYTIGLPSTIAGLFSSKKKYVANDELPYVMYSPQERKAIAEMSKMISVDEDPIYSTIEIKVVAENAKQASVLASSVLDRLQKEVIEHKTRRAKYMLDFIQERYSSANLEYETIRQRFFDYKDSHRNMIDERVNVEYQRLSDQYDLSYSILKSISSQLEQAKLAFMENTPVFSVVQPVVLPSSKSGPKMSIHIVIGVFVGGLISIGFLLGQIAWNQIFNEERIGLLMSKYK